MDELLLNQLDDLYRALQPKSICMIGVQTRALIDYFMNRAVSVQMYEINQVEVPGSIQPSEIAFLDESIIYLEAYRQDRLFEQLAKACPGLVLHVSHPGDAGTIQRLRQIHGILQASYPWRELDRPSAAQAFRIYRSQPPADPQRIGKSRRQFQELIEINRRLIQQNQDLRQQNAGLAYQIDAFWSSRTGSLLKDLSAFRNSINHPENHSGSMLSDIWKSLGSFSRVGRLWLSARMGSLAKRLRIPPLSASPDTIPLPPQGVIVQLSPVSSAPPVRAHTEAVSLIVSIQNNYQAVVSCLESIWDNTPPPFELILIDDGAAPEISAFLINFAGSHAAKLIRNQTSRCDTSAANQGLRLARGEFVGLLPGNAIVPLGWLDRMITCAQTSERVGIIGPLSSAVEISSTCTEEPNAAETGFPDPEYLRAQELGRQISDFSARIFPQMSQLKDSVLIIRRTLIDEIGYLDETQFGERAEALADFALRARSAGWLLKLADDVYTQHVSLGCSSNRKGSASGERQETNDRTEEGTPMQREVNDALPEDRLLAGLQARTSVLHERVEAVGEGRNKFSGKRILFVLPIAMPGGGGNVVICEANALQRMGVEAVLFNLIQYRESFLLSYPSLDIPVVFGEIEELPAIAAEYDAVIATFNESVSWFEKIPPHLVETLGYYIQGFEPLMYATGTVGYEQALQSYTLLPQMKCFTKTEWTQRKVSEATGRTCSVVGVSVNLDLMLPRPRNLPEWPGRPLRIAAMIRPESPYREPEKTMTLLRQAVHTYPDAVQAILFGTTADDPRFLALPRDFAWSLYGILTQKQIANLFADIDIFIDYSSHQAMGLTALEAMASGCAVILPLEGGAVSFAINRENSLVVDTESYAEVWSDLQELIENHELRKTIQRNALRSVCAYYPEKPALKILETLFGNAD